MDRPLRGVLPTTARYVPVSGPFVSFGGRTDVQSVALAANATSILLLGACAQRAFAYETVAAPQSLDDFAVSLARTLLAGIS